jgi:hypothetical protein
MWIVIGYLICAFLCYGMLFSDMQNRFLSIAKQSYREDMGSCIFFGLVFALAGPIGVAIAYLITGFAKYGFKVK